MWKKAVSKNEQKLRSKLPVILDEIYSAYGVRFPENTPVNAMIYAVALMITQFGNIFLSGATVNVVGLIAAILILGAMIYMLFRPYKEATRLTVKNKKLALGTK